MVGGGEGGGCTPSGEDREGVAEGDEEGQGAGAVRGKGKGAVDWSQHLRAHGWQSVGCERAREHQFCECACVRVGVCVWGGGGQGLLC